MKLNITVVSRELGLGNPFSVIDNEKRNNLENIYFKMTSNFRDNEAKTNLCIAKPFQQLSFCARAANTFKSQTVFGRLVHTSPNLINSSRNSWVKLKKFERFFMVEENV